MKNENTNLARVLGRVCFDRSPIIVNISNRHAHVSAADLSILFGPGAALTPVRDLIQPGQFACAETVTIEGPKGGIANVRIIGPVRSRTQVEISRTDSFLLGVRPPVRESGVLGGSAPITVIGPSGKVVLDEGCIIAQRHVHLTPDDARKYGVSDKQVVNLLAGKGGSRETVFRDVVCRVSDTFATECHLDTDEANAAMVCNGDKVYLCLDDAVEP
jgi:putative phosphotransacetylase